MTFSQEELNWNKRTIDRIITGDIVKAAMVEYDRFFSSFSRAAKKYLAATLSPRELGGIMGIAWEKALFKQMQMHITKHNLGLLEDIGANDAGAGGDFAFTDRGGRRMLLEVKITGQRTPAWITNAAALMRKDHGTVPVNYILTARDNEKMFSAVALAVTTADWNIPLKTATRSARAATFNKSVFLQKGRSTMLVGSANKIGVAGGTRLVKDLF